MAFTIPNYLDALEYPASSGLYPQAQVDKVDFDILQAQLAGDGVSSGCAVTQRAAGANQSVDVASGTVVVASTEVVVTSGNVAATAAHATLPRFDLVVVNNAGTKSITAGTAASTPVFPAIPATSVVLAAVFRRPADNVIETAEIVDKRGTVDSPSAAAGWTTVERSADSNLAQGTTLVDDPQLQFSMVANGEYRIRGVIWASGPVNHGGWKLGVNGPTSPSLVGLHRRTFNQSSGLETSANDFLEAYDTTGVTMQSAGASVFFLGAYWEGIVHNGVNAGTFRLTNAQVTSDVDLTVLRAGGYLEYARVD